MSYFEMVAKYEDGYPEEEGKAGEYFRAGVRSVFPEVAGFPNEVVTEVMERLWKETRCGMYHRAITGGEGKTRWRL